MPDLEITKFNASHTIGISYRKGSQIVSAGKRGRMYYDINISFPVIPCNLRSIEFINEEMVKAIFTEGLERYYKLNDMKFKELHLSVLRNTTIKDRTVSYTELYSAAVE